MEPPRNGNRGYIIPIGGSEDRSRDSAILRRFVALCGDRSARIVVIPTASAKSDTGPTYEDVFYRLGAGEVTVLRLGRRWMREHRDSHRAIERATGVFFTGGDQMRLSKALNGTAIADLLRRGNAGGLHIAGTSAGAAFLCDRMIARGHKGSTPQSGMVVLDRGLGLTDRLIIDQHFRQRDRLGRLLTAIAHHPGAMGIGVDEDTAAFFAPDGTVSVLGSGAVTIVDHTPPAASAIALVDEGQPFDLVDVKLHILCDGAEFDTVARAVTASAARRNKDDEQ